ncbi:MAG: glycerol kinase GlpK [Planctomycetes bacterium]|nr:glycerol kinase GlpK [Planctomycetota bacterium]
MTASLILALDQGTTSSRAILFDRQGNVLGVAQREFAQHYPKAGWVEHDASEIWETQLAVAREVLSKTVTPPEKIAAIGITNQRETTVLWDRRTGRPLHRAIVWQDRRTAERCDELRQQGIAPRIEATTGLVLDPYFSGTKLEWLLNHVSGARSLADAGHLAFGTIDSWLIWNLTGGKLHVTDSSNASRTMLMRLQNGAWDEEMLQLLNIPRSVLPEIRHSSGVLGMTDAEHLGIALPIAGVAGDQQAALFGQNCVHHGMAKNTYGTGCFMLMHIGDKPTPSKRKLLTSVAWSTQRGIEYALEGSVFIAGAAVQWLRDGLGIIRSSAEVEALAKSVEDNDGVYLVPAFAGLGAPHWDAYARGTIVGITRRTTAGHLARAALEGIAFQVADVLSAMEQDSEIQIRQLRVDGGASANDLLMQFQADIMQVPVVRPRIIETTALGAAYLAGLAVGYWSSMEEIESLWQAEKVFEPIMSSDEAQQRRARWVKALERSRDWEEPDSISSQS